jgi:hypothetical protein
MAPGNRSAEMMINAGQAQLDAYERGRYAGAAAEREACARMLVDIACEQREVARNFNRPDSATDADILESIAADIRGYNPPPRTGGTCPSLRQARTASRFLSGMPLYLAHQAQYALPLADLLFNEEKIAKEDRSEESAFVAGVKREREAVLALIDEYIEDRHIGDLGGEEALSDFRDEIKNATHTGSFRRSSPSESEGK